MKSGLFARFFVYVVDDLRGALSRAGEGGQRVGIQSGQLLRRVQRAHIRRAGAEEHGVHRAAVEVHRVGGEHILVAAAAAVQTAEQVVQRGTDAVAGGGDRLAAVGAAQQVEQEPGGVHRQLLLQRRHNAAPQAALFRAALSAEVKRR